MAVSNPPISSALLRSGPRPSRSRTRPRDAATLLELADTSRNEVSDGAQDDDAGVSGRRIAITIAQGRIAVAAGRRVGDMAALPRPGTKRPRRYTEGSWCRRCGTFLFPDEKVCKAAPCGPGWRLENR